MTAKEISLKINGQIWQKSIEPRELLSDFIRNHAQLTGTHVGCDTSQCGACTIILNGESVKSCAVLAISADGAEITTIEGMANHDGSLGIIQQAFRDCHGLQCGFCTPGMIICASQIIKDAQNNGKFPTDQEIRHGLDGNLCRCTGYQNIIEAVKSAAKRIMNEAKNV